MSTPLSVGLLVAVSYGSFLLIGLLTAVGFTAFRHRTAAKAENSEHLHGNWRLRFHRFSLKPTPVILSKYCSMDTNLHVAFVVGILLLQAVLIGIPLPGYFSWEPSRAGYLSLPVLGFVMLLGGRLIPLGRLLRIAVGEVNKGHRWMGWCFVSLVAVHSVGYISIWIQADSLELNMKRRKVGQGLASLLWLGPLILTSLPHIRHRYYNLFRATHLCFIPFLACISAHTTYAAWFYGPPLVVWCIDRCVRLSRAMEPVHDVSAERMVGGLVKIKFSVESRDLSPGCYVYLRCPSIAWGEWHPFSLTEELGEKWAAKSDSEAASTRTRCQVCVRATGQFTSRLYASTAQLLPLLAESTTAPSAHQHHNPPETQSKPSAIPRPAFSSLEIDGPYGQPTYDPSIYSVNVVIAGGVGAAPMIGWLSNILRSRRKSRCAKVIWVWVIKDQAYYSWFSRDLQVMRQSCCMEPSSSRNSTTGSVSTSNVMSTSSKPIQRVHCSDQCKLETMLFITGTKNSTSEQPSCHVDPADTAAMNKSERSIPHDSVRMKPDIVDPDRQPPGSENTESTVIQGEKEADFSEETVNYGRPDLDQVLRRVKESEGTDGDVGVSVCGPPSLLRSVRQACADQSERSCLFHLHSEVFSL